MTNYFYADANGHRQGPCNFQEIQDKAAQRIITPTTPMETDGGHRGVAGQIPGLKFNTVEPSPFEQTAQTAGAHVQRTARSSLLWLFDFAFRDIRVHIVNLWAIRIIYVICWITAVLWGLLGTFGLFLAAADDHGHVGSILLIPFIWLGIAILMFFCRLYLELCLIVLDWIIETTKAARIYIENNKREQKK